MVVLARGQKAIRFEQILDQKCDKAVVGHMKHYNHGMPLNQHQSANIRTQRREHEKAILSLKADHPAAIQAATSKLGQQARSRMITAAFWHAFCAVLHKEDLSRRGATSLEWLLKGHTASFLTFVFCSVMDSTLR